MNITLADLTLGWKWEHVAESFPQLMKGLMVTLEATFGGMVLALMLGLVLAILRRSKAVWISWPVVGVIEFIRSTPLLIQLFFVFFLMPDWGWNTPLVTGILVLGIHYSTYTSEVYRSGINAVPVGQWEAGTALNLSRSQMWTRVILPQAFPPIVPAMGNYLVAMFKDTPLLFAISVPEMLALATNYNSRVFSYVETYTMVGVIFLLLSFAAASLIRLTERYLVIREA